MSLNIVAGAFRRREIRRWLQSIGVYFYEDKGWLDSLFVVVAEPPMLRGIRKRLDEAGVDSTTK